MDILHDGLVGLPDYTVEECLQLPKAVRQVTSAPIGPPSIGYREQGAPLGLL